MKGAVLRMLKCFELHTYHYGEVSFDHFVVIFDRNGRSWPIFACNLPLLACLSILPC